MTKWVYFFGAGVKEGNKDLKELLGGKGANLAQMGQLDIPVPAGFTITTAACLEFLKNNKSLNSEIKSQISSSLERLEKLTGQTLGDLQNPLLVSVRSGAPASMPGMMDTVLNLGLNDKTVLSLAKNTGNERFAWDCYRRLIQMYGDVVLGMGTHLFDTTLETLKESLHVKQDFEIPASSLKELVHEYQRIILEETSNPFPQNVQDQLWNAIGAVFSSWNNFRAVKYREIHNIPNHWGTAVNIQAMVFGNKGQTSATGVCFSRNPSTGATGLYGEYLIQAQGEDVVAGIRNPWPINSTHHKEDVQTQGLDKTMPTIYKELVDVVNRLEAHYADMQDVEFTIEEGKLYILQTRNGKRTAQAALKIAIDLVNEKKISIQKALLKVSPRDLDQLLHPRLNPDYLKTAQALATGLPASPGGASGVICFHPDRVNEYKEKGEKVLLVREETSPEDIVGMEGSVGILTSRGGMTSHAAVVARGMGKVCVVGVQDIKINEKDLTLTIPSLKNKTFKEGDFLTLDGTTGKIYEGVIPTLEMDLGEDFHTLMKWADECRRMKIRANADNGADTIRARKFGAQGIGLCRTEHMFFAKDRILAVREMIFAQSEMERRKALEKIYPFQCKDFIEIFEAMDGYPVNIRLLDPPLHEFLPHEQREIEELAHELKISIGQVQNRISQLHEVNPMLGHRGCRLGITYPEIYETQVKAIIEAAILVTKNSNHKIKVKPEIMIPLVGCAQEFLKFKEWIPQWVNPLFESHKVKIEYKVGSMVEVPRLALTIDEIASESDFFSFGTNDLTQMTYGISRDDAAKFMPVYVGQGYYPKDPFVTIDEKGVGALVKMTTTQAKKSNPNIHVGVCGEHGGDPDSIEFFDKVDLDYVSCSPFRVPLARLAAAIASIKSEWKNNK